MTDTKQNENDNVTLRDITLYVNGFIRFVYSLLLAIGLILKKYAWIFILAVLLGAGWGFMKHKKQTTCYQGGITCVYNELHKKVYGEMIVLLNDQIRNHADSIVAELLGVSPEVAGSLESIQAKNIAGSPLQDDITSDKVPFYITYMTTDPGYVKEINQGLLHYFLNTRYNNLRRGVRLDNARQKVAFINTQLLMLDSLKMSFIKYISKGGAVSSSNSSELNIAELFKESETLFNGKQDAEWVLKFDNAVEIVYEQLPLRMESGSGLYKHVAKGILLSFGAFFVIVVCWHIGRRVGNEQA